MQNKWRNVKQPYSSETQARFWLVFSTYAIYQSVCVRGSRQDIKQGCCRLVKERTYFQLFHSIFYFIFTDRAGFLRDSAGSATFIYFLFTFESKPWLDPPIKTVGRLFVHRRSIGGLQIKKQYIRNILENKNKINKTKRKRKSTFSQ